MEQTGAGQLARAIRFAIERKQAERARRETKED